MMNIVALILLALVIVVGVAMAASGASPDSYMGLVLLACGGMMLWTGFKYRKDPTFKNAAGEDQAVGPGMIIFMFAIGVVLVAGGLFALFHGFQ